MVVLTKKYVCLKSTIVIKICVCVVGCSYKFLGTVHTRKGPKTRILVKFNRYTVCEKV